MEKYPFNAPFRIPFELLATLQFATPSHSRMDVHEQLNPDEDEICDQCMQLGESYIIPANTEFYYVIFDNNIETVVLLCRRHYLEGDFDKPLDL